MKKRPLSVVGQGISEKCRESLCRMGFDVVILPPYDRLGAGVDTHADLMIFPIDGKAFIYSEVAKNLPELANDLHLRGYETVEVDRPPANCYPYDIPLNCLQVGRYIFCKKKYTSPSVIEYAEENGYAVVNTNQGYARCTACPIGNMGIISADPSMLKAADSARLDILSICEGYVRLEGYDHGFIGGACGVYENTLYFAGDISRHPDYESIADFCRERGVEVVSLSDEPLCDVGSIFFFDGQK